jgi:hypothetical protein
MSKLIPVTTQEASHTQQTPQQIPRSNHNIRITDTHISQVATSRAITPAAAFSEAEESNKSDDNDVRLSWQQVKGRGKKRTSPKTTRAPTLEMNKSKETSNSPMQLAATNRCEALRHAETEGSGRHEIKDPAPPPMFVPRNTNMQRLAATTEQVINRLNYTLKIINNDTIKILITE